jgi:hypothetical protein
MTHRTFLPRPSRLLRPSKSRLLDVLLGIPRRDRRRPLPPLSKDAPPLTGTSLLKVAIMADLMRIRGVGVHFAELLQETGISLAELRRQSPERLAERMAQVNGVKRITRRPPSVAQVRAWVEQAQSLEPIVPSPGGARQA